MIQSDVCGWITAERSSRRSRDASGAGAGPGALQVLGLVAARPGEGAPPRATRELAALWMVSVAWTCPSAGAPGLVSTAPLWGRGPECPCSPGTGWRPELPAHRARGGGRADQDGVAALSLTSYSEVETGAPWPVCSGLRSPLQRHCTFTCGALGSGPLGWEHPDFPGGSKVEVL